MFSETKRKNRLQTVVAPDNDEALWINQDAWFSLTDMSEHEAITYDLHKPGQGVYVFVIEGEVTVDNNTLSPRDAIGIWDVDNIEVKTKNGSRLLFIEVPMN